MAEMKFLVVCLLTIGEAIAQEESICYGPGSIAASVLGTLIVTLLVLFLLYFIGKRYWNRKNEKHLMVETDPEKGKGEYAFDNPGFKDTTLNALNEAEKNQSDSLKTKWSHWSPLSALTARNEKRTFLDDSVIGKDEIKVVCLRSHDFTGLGFNIFGNMRDGIFIKDILHRGPAFESGKLNAGDRIKSITINFEHIVYEDALTILSYASPYEVIIEAQGEKRNCNLTGQAGQPCHPLFRSSSNTDLVQIGKSAKKRLFQANTIYNSLNSSYSSLQKIRSNATTLERKHSNSPSLGIQKDLLKAQLEQRILEDHDFNLKNKYQYEEDQKKTENKMQKSESKLQKFGIRVLPPEVSQSKEQISPKVIENSQNDNNSNLERNSLYNIVMSEYHRLSIDEVDKKSEKNETQEHRVTDKKLPEENSPSVPQNEDYSNWQRSPNQSSVKRDKDGIPQEIPNHMHNVAMVAKRNRKSSSEKIIDEPENLRTPKKTKGRAPAPPEEKCCLSNINTENGEHELDDSCLKTSDCMENLNLLDKMPDKILTLSESCFTKQDNSSLDSAVNESSYPGSKGTEKNITEILHINKGGILDYVLDSDADSDNQSSVNTIALNSSDITIHHTEESGNEIQNRKTASTGDLSKIQKSNKVNISTLERAQSLDIADTGIKKRKSGNHESEFEPTDSDDSIYANYIMHKEPRLSLVLDGLNTFQRSRLKKSTEWGNLEDAILSLDKDTNYEESKNSLLSKNSREFDALVNKINEIKKEGENAINKERSKEIIHKTYNDLTEIANKDRHNSKNEFHEKLRDPYESVQQTSAILDSSANELDNKIVEVNKPEIPLINNKLEIKLSHEEHEIQKSNTTADNDLLKSTSKAVINDLPGKHIEQAAEIPRRRAKNQIWPKNELENITPINSIEKQAETKQLENNSCNIVVEVLSETIPIKHADASNNFSNKMQDELSDSKSTIFSNGVSHILEETAEKKVEVPKRKPKNQIWPAVELENINCKVSSSDLTSTTPKADTNIREKQRETPPEANKYEQSLVTVTNVTYINTQENEIKEKNNIIEKDKKSSVESKEPSLNDPDKTIVNSKLNLDAGIQSKMKTQISSKFFKPKVIKELSENLILAEKYASVDDHFYNSLSTFYDLNVSDDMKVSRHSLGSLQSDAKILNTEKPIKHLSENNVSSVKVVSPYLNNPAYDNSVNISSLPVNGNGSNTSFNNTTSLYTTALDETITKTNDLSESQTNDNKLVTVTAPGTIRNSSSSEIINIVNPEETMLDKEPKPLKLQVVGDLDSDEIEFSKSCATHISAVKKLDFEKEASNSDSNDSITFITEIQVSPSLSINSSSLSEVEITKDFTKPTANKNLENKFESYVKNFEVNRKMFDSPSTNTNTHCKSESRIPAKITIGSEKIEPEKELKKIQEIAEEQLKKLPEMKFSTSSYESSKIPEKRSSHIEQIRSNFEKSPTKQKPETSVKSRIPVATQKTPPTSPERRDSRPDTEINSDILELMSSKVHSTPITNNLRYQPKIPVKNVTVTPIRGNSKIPSAGRPPVPTRKPESSETHTNNESHFKQWVFTQTDPTVTNIMVDNFKTDQK